MAYLLIIVGLGLIIKGADFLTEGSASLARRLGLSELVIGLTIVSIGTSAPEFVVSIVASIKGSSDVAVGNIVGSNLFNTLMILGVASFFSTIRIRRINITRDVPFVLITSLILFILGSDTLLAGASGNYISRVDGIILTAMFLGFMYYTLATSPKGESSDKNIQRKSILKICTYLLGGLGGLVVGGKIFVDNAIIVATQLGASEHIIAISLMAGGTSLPELATTIVAARKGSTQMAIGNIIGSNIFNILFVLGVSAIIKPLTLGNITSFDLGYVFFSSILLFASLFFWGKFKIFYQDGIVFTIAYLAYMVLLFY